ncbi:radical SAM protein (plasmid) [Paraclostridium ghonii]|uniref:B12-binding domain-containing radical SAM protein n=1 Tax=Paraclostridium ghonii TaxID=29358 RepID=UPI00202D0CA8|nr:radical SAM protein [Paeniclostridium ghonii]MCM0165809.1 radical SAM protein [Paeniclostridium ghonii]
MKCNPLLIFPPGWSPFGPYAALPVLKGYLEKHNMNSTVIDLNLDFYNEIFSERFIDKCYKKCFEKFNILDLKSELTKSEKEQYRKFSKAVLMKNVKINIEEAKNIIKTRNYYDSDKAHFSKNILFNALYLTSLAYDGDFKFNRFTLDYSVRSSYEVMQSLDDIDKNPFIDFFNNGIIKKIKISNYNTVALSITGNSQLIPTLTLAKLIKEKCSNIKHISVGGNYITRISQGWKDKHDFFKYIDSIMTFEGEKSLHNLLLYLNGDLDIKDVPNLMYVQDDKLIINPSYTLDVNEFTTANYDDLPLDDYYMPEKVIPIFTSRSCFSKCAFCSIPYSSKDKYRSLEICTVFNDMKLFNKKYNVENFAFVDETFTPDKMLKLSRCIKEEGLSFKWYGETRFSPLFTQEFCKELYDGGCRKIQFGLESYNQEILNKMQKGIKKDWIHPTIQNCFKAGISVHMFFMVGFPGEKREQALNTILFTRKMYQESRHKYNNPNTTFGWDVFGLDKYSDVWLNPDKYGVSIKNGSDYYDLDIQYDFNVIDGMSQLEAKNLSEQYNKDPYINIKNFGIHPFQDMTNQIYSEEEKFLLNCMRNLKTEKTYNTRILLDTGSYINLKYNSDIEVIKLNYDISTMSLKKSEIYCIYTNNNNSVYIIDNTMFNLLKNNYMNTFEVEITSNIKNSIEDLIFYGFVQIEGYINSSEYDFNNSKLIFNENSIVFDINQDDGLEKELFCYTTGSQIKINEFSYDLLTTFDGNLSAKELFSLVIEEKIEIDPDIYRELIYSALNSSILNIVKGGEGPCLNLS